MARKTRHRRVPPALSFPTDDSGGNSSRNNLKGNIAKVEEELLKQERSFSHYSSKDTLQAFLSYAASDIHLMRRGHFPVAGKEAMRKALTAAPATLVWEPIYAPASRSGDLGYTYGTYELKATAQGDKPASVEKGNYVRIWKRKDDGKWKVVIDVLAPYGGRG